MEIKKAVVLLSGGLDSTTALHFAKYKGFSVYAITFDYGQRHKKEMELAKKTAKEYAVAHQIVSINMNEWGGSALTDNSIEVPDYKEENQEIPVTYVPARNMIFLSIAASYAEVIGSQDVFIGVSQIDYSGYVDCRKEFIDAMEQVINKGTVCAVENGKPIRLHTPFINMSKTDEIKLGAELGVNYEDTWSCYKGEGIACGTCDSCKLRLKAFEEAGMVDPIKYVVR